MNIPKIVSVIRSVLPFQRFARTPKRRTALFRRCGPIQLLEDRALLSAPTFDTSVANLDVSEDTAIAAQIGLMSATDMDGDPLEFEIVSGDPGNNFSIDPAGILTVASPLDAASNSTYELTLQVSDGAETDTATVFINVIEPPVITSFSATNVSGNSWLFQGQVAHEDPSTVTITFGGPLEGESVQVAADGSFSLTVEMTSGQEGAVTAIATDMLGLESELVPDEVEDDAVEDPGTAPFIESFSATNDAGNSWTFDGLVTHEDPSSLTITFGGLLEGHSVAVNLDGTFSYTIELQPGEEGVVSAETTDDFGQTSNMVEDIVLIG